jgi:phospholipase C
MKPTDRRQFLRGAAGAAAASTLSLYPPWLRQALAVEPDRRTGTLMDVAHIVVLTQENRSFDHYFGSLQGVRGFGDRFPIPVPGEAGVARNVWQQPRALQDALPGPVLPFRLNTEWDFALMRAEGTAHSWPDAQQAWDQGRMGQWTLAKGEHSMGYYTRADLPFQHALADAFTVCDAYHASFQGGTNTNRLFLWTGSNDPHALAGGPATYNDLDSLQSKPEFGHYSWTPYAERLQAAGIRWQVYQDMADNYDDNPLAGFKAFRDAAAGVAGSATVLRERGLSTRNLSQLRADVRANALPQVSWIVATAAGSEHPERSSPAQGADYTAQVLEALTSNPEVWSRTVLLLNYDENDGFFDHVPPPAAPSGIAWHADAAQAVWAGASTVDTRGEYHEHLVNYHRDAAEQALLHRPYGLGPRVPMLVISPWSRGGWVNSQVFDHTSVLRFMEQRFGVLEPNISPWRRAVCGDLTSTLDFTRPDRSALPPLPPTAQLARRAAALAQRKLAAAPVTLPAPTQEPGTRSSRALPYALQVNARCQPAALALVFANAGTAAAVFHVYDRLRLSQLPRRYTVGAGRQLEGAWPPVGQNGAYDLWVLGPNGFHRHFAGALTRPSAAAPRPELELAYEPAKGEISARLLNDGDAACSFELTANAYFDPQPSRHGVAAHSALVQSLPLRASGHWYDFTLRAVGLPGFCRRFAGRMETGADSISDPAMGSPLLANGRAT